MCKINFGSRLAPGGKSGRGWSLRTLISDLAQLSEQTMSKRAATIQLTSANSDDVTDDGEDVSVSIVPGVACKHVWVRFIWIPFPSLSFPTHLSL